MADLPELPLVGDEFARYRLRIFAHVQEPPTMPRIHHNIGFAGAPMNM